MKKEVRMGEGMIRGRKERVWGFGETDFCPGGKKGRAGREENIYRVENCKKVKHGVNESAKKCIFCSSMYLLIPP